jgi:N-acetyl-anhydromuramyl-L-alanine amidase AmpD
MTIIDRTELGLTCPRRDLSKITTVLVHRIEDAENATDLAQFFRDHPEYTGGKMGYHILIQRDGVVEQAVEFARASQGAIVANPYSIQIACVGDLTKYPLTTSQQCSLLDTCVDLCEWIGYDKAQLKGHTEIPGATRDPKKDCPGKMLDMGELRKLVWNWACSTDKAETEEHLIACGYTFTRQ